VRESVRERDGEEFALTWYRALNWYSSPARPFAAPDVPFLVTGQQGGPSPACRLLSRAWNVCVGGSSAESTTLGHDTKLGRTLCYGWIDSFRCREIDRYLDRSIYIYIYIYIYIHIYICIYLYLQREIKQRKRERDTISLYIANANPPSLSGGLATR